MTPKPISDPHTNGLYEQTPAAGLTQSSPRPTSRLAPGLAIQVSQIQGRGCFATQFFPWGAKIADYEGELISWEEAAYRRRNGQGHCICDLDDEQCIDGKVGGNGTEFINHACTPNCELLLIAGNLSIFALRDIVPGEEITADYLTSLDQVEISCRCLSCRGEYQTSLRQTNV